MSSKIRYILYGFLSTIALLIFYVSFINLPVLFLRSFVQSAYPTMMAESYSTLDFEEKELYEWLTPQFNFGYVALVPNSSNTNVTMHRLEITRYGFFWWEFSDKYTYDFASTLTSDYIKKLPEEKQAEFFEKVKKNFETKEKKAKYYDFIKEQSLSHDYYKKMK